MKPRMSSLVMRPAEPLPETWVRSTLLSLAMRRTSGEERRRSPVAEPTPLVAEAETEGSVVDGGGATAVAVAATGAEAPSDFAAAAGALEAAAPAAPPMVATTVLICTV
jgi:hypothetical protein